MDLLEIIKIRRTTRQYTDKPIPKEIIKKIVTAGIWGPSVLGMQPSKFIIIENKEIIMKICKVLTDKVNTLDAGGRFIFNTSLQALNTAPVIISVYSSEILTKFEKKFGRIYFKIVRISDISSISASIQNIILAAQNFGIGSCWLVTPLICEKKINKILKTDDKLLAILTLGYPAKKKKRSKRKPWSKIVRYIK